MRVKAEAMAGRVDGLVPALLPGQLRRLGQQLPRPVAPVACGCEPGRRLRVEWPDRQCGLERRNRLGQALVPQLPFGGGEVPAGQSELRPAAMTRGAGRQKIRVGRHGSRERLVGLRPSLLLLEGQRVGQHPGGPALQLGLLLLDGLEGILRVAVVGVQLGRPSQQRGGGVQPALVGELQRLAVVVGRRLLTDLPQALDALGVGRITDDGVLELLQRRLPLLLSGQAHALVVGDAGLGPVELGDELGLLGQA